MRRTGTAAVSAFTALLLLALVTNTAQAGDDLDAARDHYQKGKRAYDIGHFAEAAKEYELAYAAKDDPALLFNLGQAQRLAGNRTAAVLAYKAYLRNAPDAPNRAEVEQRIEEVQATPSSSSIAGSPSSRSTAKTVSPAPTQPTNGPSPSLPSPTISTSAPQPPHRRPPYKKWWFWTVAGVVAGAAATAVAVGVTQGQPREPVLQVHSP